MSRLILLILCVALIACTYAPRTPAPQQPTVASAFTVPTMIDPVLSQGQSLYNRWCAHCHGYNGEGQLASTVENTLNLGMKTVPAHDSTGHTWQHPDNLLVQVIKKGIQNPLNHYQMPAFEGTLTDTEINSLLSYMRQWWTDEQRQHQAAVTQRWLDTND